MPTTTIRRLIVALMIGSGLWMGSVGAAAAGQVPSTAPTTLAGSTPTSTATSTPRPPNPDDGLQVEDVREFAEDNTVAIIVVVGLLLLIALWKFVSRPATKKF